MVAGPADSSAPWRPLDHGAHGALLIEEYEGNFPLWLAPTQAVVIPIADRHAQEVAAQLKAVRLRVEVDNRSDRMNAKIRDAQPRESPTCS